MFMDCLSWYTYIYVKIKNKKTILYVSYQLILLGISTNLKGDPCYHKCRFTLECYYQWYMTIMSPNINFIWCLKFGFVGILYKGHMFLWCKHKHVIDCKYNIVKHLLYCNFLYELLIFIDFCYWSTIYKNHYTPSLKIIY